MIDNGLFAKFIKYNSSIIEDIIISDSLFKSVKVKLQTSLFLGIYIAISLLFLQTFIAECTLEYFIIFIKIVGICFIASLFCFSVFGIIDNKFLFKLHRWVKYSLLFVINVIFIALVLFLMLIYGGLHALENSYLSLFYDVLIVMFLPGISFVLFVENYLIRDRLKIIAAIKNTNNDDYADVKDLDVVIKSDNIKESLKINMRDFIYAKSDDNYSSIFYKNNGKISKALFRITLKKLENQFDQFDFTIRCHKSFIINIDHIKEIEGTSQNYRIIMKEVDIQVPVSRNFPKSIIDSLKERNVSN